MENLIWKTKPVKCGTYMKTQDKMDWVSGVAVEVLTIDPKIDAIYESPLSHISFVMAAIKAYTDIKVPEDADKRIKMYDEMRQVGFIKAFLESPAGEDLEELQMVFDKYLDNVLNGFNAQTDFGRKIGRLLGDVNPGDAMKLALQNEEILDMIRRAHEHKDEPKQGKILQFPAGVMKKQIDE